MPLDAALVAAKLKSIVVGAAQKSLGALIEEHSRSVALGRQLSAAYDRTLQDTGLSAYNAVTALLADVLKRPPTDPEIRTLMEDAAQNPHFPARAVRLIQAARMSTSTRRRAMLASVLYGLPFTKTPEDDRDRIDMLVERLLPEDIELLGKVDDLSEVDDTTGRVSSECVALAAGGVRLFQQRELDRLSMDGLNARPSVSVAAFATLRSTGCIELPDAFDSELIVGGVTVSSGTVLVTALGDLLLNALDDVHAGVESYANASRAP